MNNIFLHKMNGLGNKFLVFDNRKYPTVTLSYTDILSFSDTKNQVTGGCDQFIVLKDSSEADVFMQIFNLDGSEVDACGNATRCIAWMESKSLNNKKEIGVETNFGILNSQILENGSTVVSVNMNAPVFEWNKIPLSNDVGNVLELPVQFNGVSGSAVSMGNPHLVFILEENVDNLDLQSVGPALENHPLYPKKTNVSFANIIDNKNIRLRVFERGVGETAACGTAACATHVIARSKGLVDATSTIHLNGGDIVIFWKDRSQDFLRMTGDTEYTGKVEVSL